MSMLSICEILNCSSGEVKLAVISLVTSSRFLLFITIPLDISSVKSLIILGENIARMALKAAKIKEVKINSLKFFRP